MSLAGTLCKLLSNFNVVHVQFSDANNFLGPVGDTTTTWTECAPFLWSLINYWTHIEAFQCLFFSLSLFPCEYTMFPKGTALLSSPSLSSLDFTAFFFPVASHRTFNFWSHSDFLYWSSIQLGKSSFNDKTAILDCWYSSNCFSV